MDLHHSGKVNMNEIELATGTLNMVFDRSSRTKSESLCGLEEVLSCLQPSEFEDEQLSRFKGMCWTDFVSYMEGGQQAGADTPTSTESQDAPLLKSESHFSTTNPPLVALNDRALLITPSKPLSERSKEPSPSVSSSSTASSASYDRQGEKLDRLSSLTCLERETPLPRKRHPMTIMRTMSERSLDRGRAGHLLSLLSERVHNIDRSSLKSHHKPAIGGLTNTKGYLMNVGPTAVTAVTTNTTSNISAGLSNMGGGIGGSTSVNEGGFGGGVSGVLSGVDRVLEAARDNVQAALNKNETKRREAVWDLFQSECAFLYDHLMVLKNTAIVYRILSDNLGPPAHQLAPPSGCQHHLVCQEGLLIPFWKCMILGKLLFLGGLKVRELSNNIFYKHRADSFIPQFFFKDRRASHTPLLDLMLTE
ncbi:hypothetical protein SK128_004991 [Halocaridina rubra]|uniref:Uncharacterized protein n=1 Tax=Halocaridina rubra TaxID=373956 RepID=A0AAN8ZW74_HALRR